MEVCSSNEMGAPGASHLGTGDHHDQSGKPASHTLNILRCSTHNATPDVMQGHTPGAKARFVAE